MRSIYLLSACGLLALTTPARAEAGQQYPGPASDCEWIDLGYLGRSYACYTNQVWEAFDPPYGWDGQSYGGQTYGGQSYDQPYLDDSAERFRTAYYESELGLDESIPAEGTRKHGLIVDALQIPADPPIDSTLPLSVHYLSHIRGDELALALDPTTAVFDSWSQRLKPRHKHVEDYRVRSCAGYVYKRWYEYSRFEDAARTCGTDAACVFAIGTAWSSPGIAGPTLFQLAPGIHTIPAVLTPSSQDVEDGQIWLPYAVKNDFFAVAPETILRASSQYERDPAFMAEAEELIPAVGEPALHDQTNKMQWHVEMAAAQAPLELTRVERKDIKWRLARYRRLVDEYRVLRAQLSDEDLPIGVDLGGSLSDTGLSDSTWSSTVSFLGGSTDISETPMVVVTGDALTTGLSPEVVTAIAYRAVVDEMADLLMYEWRHVDPREPMATDHGCLVNNACDWLPDMFAADYVGRFQSEREADMQRCVEATGLSGKFPEDAELKGPAWATDVITLEAHLGKMSAELDARLAELPFDTAPAVGTAKASKNIHWGIQPVSESKGIEGLLHGQYEHHATADLAINFDGDRICSMSAKIDAGILAKYTAPDPYLPKPHTLIDGKLKLLVAREGKAFEAEAYLMIADQELFKFNPSIPITGDTWSAPPQTTHFAIYDYALQFSILGIPAYLSVSIQGDLAFAPRITVPPFNDSCAKDTAEIMPVIEGTIDSSIDVDADGRLAIGVPGFSFGVNGHIDMLTATMPATARFSVISDEGAPTLLLETKARIDAVLLAGSLSVYAEALFVYAEKAIFGWDGIPVGFDLWKNQVKLPLTFLKKAFTPPAPVGDGS